MLTWRQALTYLVLAYCCIYGTHWIGLYACQGRLSSSGMGLVLTLLFLSAYPLLAWQRHSPWVRIGSWRSWLLLALVAGLITFLVATAAGLVVRHFST